MELRDREKIVGMPTKEALEALSTDPGIAADMPARGRITGQAFRGTERDGNVFKVNIGNVKE